MERVTSHFPSYYKLLQFDLNIKTSVLFIEIYETLNLEGLINF